MKIYDTFSRLLVCCEKRSRGKNCPSAKKREFLSHHDFGVFALEVNKMLHAMPPSKLMGEVGMCGTRQNEKKNTKKKRAKKQRTGCDGSQATAATELTAAPPIPPQQTAAQLAAASGSIRFSNKNKQHRHHHRQQQQLPFLLLSMLGPAS